MKKVTKIGKVIAIILAILGAMLLLNAFVRTGKYIDKSKLKLKKYYENYGWSNWNDKSKNMDNRVEAFKINLSDEKLISYSSYSNYYGWSATVCENEMTGVISKNAPMTKFRIQLKNGYDEKYHIEYRVCYKNNAWSKWYRDNDIAGNGKYIYNIEIRITDR